MKKILLTIAAVICISLTSFSQGRFSIGAELALPSGDWSDFVGMGFGGSLRYESPINENLSWMATAGYLSFSGKDDFDISLGMIPVMAGGKYYFTESFNGFYAGAELGMAFYSGDGEGNDFGFAPLAGYHLGSIDISAKYQLIEDANLIGFRIAYVLGGK